MPLESSLHILNSTDTNDPWFRVVDLMFHELDTLSLKFNHIMKTLKTKADRACINEPCLKVSPSLNRITCYF